MNSIMVDNMLMEEVVTDILSGKRPISQSYSDLLMSIVLWDNVYYPQNINCWWTTMPTPLRDLLTPIEDTRTEGLDLTGVPDLLTFHHGRPDVLVSGAVYYMEMSSRNNCDYLPSAKRREMMFYPSSGNIEQVFVNAYHGIDDPWRLKRMRVLDEQICAYYAEAYKDMFCKGRIIDTSLDNFPKLSMPVLTRYIFEHSRGEMDPIDYAFHLKHEGSVIRYREYLSKIEDAFEKGKTIPEIQSLLNESKEVVSDVLSGHNKFLEEVTFRILPIPSVILKFNFQGWRITIDPGSSLPVSLEKLLSGSYKKWQLTFLRDLTTDEIGRKKFW